MSIAKDLVGVGMPGAFAQLEGFSAVAAVAAAGTTTANATVLAVSQDNVQMTGTGANGIRLPTEMPLMAPYVLSAVSGTTLVYPPTGAAFNGLAVNVSIPVAVNKAAIIYRQSATACAFNLSA
jgi:hypothetical protein